MIFSAEESGEASSRALPAYMRRRRCVERSCGSRWRMSCLRPAAVRWAGSGISRRTSGIEAEKRIVRRRERSVGRKGECCAIVFAGFCFLYIITLGSF